ncbi:hypothetical protein PLESTB_001783200 [Pleodorina starrii]|uniref:Uncharacterized protein n=1 Tax=Pleodorina starrii TaxID=330485 RepID=A0A9W6F9U1_9CHLO|nr:hypothetical protein PLESTB_001782900 [Pleodorina starrii]GLC61618.1 hypothetical protein PLESTB_001783200 [Pleodorina starrii]
MRGHAANKSIDKIVTRSQKGAPLLRGLPPTTRPEPLRRRTTQQKVTRWQAWNETLLLPAPFPSGALVLTLVKDAADPQSRNALVLPQIVRRLQEVQTAISSRSLHDCLKRLPRLRQFVVSDPILLGQLKDLGALHTKASSATLASCTAVCRALRLYHSSFSDLATSILSLRFQQKTLLAPPDKMSGKHFEAAARAESRLPRSLRRPYTVAEPPGLDAPLPPPGQNPPRPPSVRQDPQPRSHMEPAVRPPNPPPSPPRPSPGRLSPPRLPPRSLRRPYNVAEPAAGLYAPLPPPGQNPPRPPSVRQDPQPRSQVEPAVRPPNPRPSPRPSPGLLSPPTGTSSWYYPTQQGFPTTFPEQTLPAFILSPKAKFGILALMKPLPNSMPFKAQLDSFKVWCQQPFNFGASGSSGVVDSTYRGIENTVSKFIGVAYLIEMIEMPLLSFHLFSNQALVARYLGLMRHRCDTNHMLAEVTRLIKVVKYLQDSASAANSDASQANVRHCDDMIAWLLRIQKQLRRHPTLKAPPPRAAPPPPPDSDDDMAQAAPASPIGTAAPTGPPSRMQPPARAAPDAAAAAAEAAAAGVTAQGRETLEPMVPVDGEEDMPAELPSKSTLLAFSTDLLQRAEERIQRDLSIGDVVGYDTARLAGDALLVAFLSGLYIPPLRLGVIRTLTVPGEPCCLSRQCVRTGCRGNSLRLTSHRQPTPSSAQQAGAVQSITVELFHHKTERYTPTATVFTLPRSLAAATKNYLEHARPVLLNYSTAEEQPPTLFVSPNGFPYDENSITVGNSWTRIQRLYRAPWTPFPARVFRHIHSTSAWGDVVREVAAMQGPLAGDARIMGNSIRTWETHYIRDRETMLGQAAISRLASWRRQQRQQQTDTPPSEPPVTAQNMAARRDQSEQLSEDEAPSQPPAPRVAAARAAAAAAEVGAPASEDVVTEGATAGVAAAEEAAATVAAPPPSSPPPPPPPPANEEHPQPPPPRPPPPPPPPQPPAHNMLAEEAGPSAGSVEQEGGRVFALRPPMQRQGEGNWRARADGRDGWTPPSEVPPARRHGFPASARGMGALETPRVLAEEAGPSAGSVEQEGGRVFALRPPMQRQGESNGRARADGRDGWMPPSEVPPARRRGFPASARGMGALETPRVLAEEAGPSAGSVEQEGGRVFALRPPMQRQGESNGRARADGRDGWMPPSEVPPARRRGFPASARGMGALETPRVLAEEAGPSAGSVEQEGGRVFALRPPMQRQGEGNGRARADGRDGWMPPSEVPPARRRGFPASARGMGALETPRVEYGRVAVGRHRDGDTKAGTYAGFPTTFSRADSIAAATPRITTPANVTPANVDAPVRFSNAGGRSTVRTPAATKPWVGSPVFASGSRRYQPAAEAGGQAGMGVDGSGFPWAKRRRLCPFVDDEAEVARGPDWEEDVSESEGGEGDSQFQGGSMEGRQAFDSEDGGSRRFQASGWLTAGPNGRMGGEEESDYSSEGAARHGGVRPAEYRGVSAPHEGPYRGRTSNEAPTVYDEDDMWFD